MTVLIHLQLLWFCTLHKLRNYMYEVSSNVRVNPSLTFICSRSAVKINPIYCRYQRRCVKQGTPLMDINGYVRPSIMICVYGYMFNSVQTLYFLIPRSFGGEVTPVEESSCFTAEILNSFDAASFIFLCGASSLLSLNVDSEKLSLLACHWKEDRRH